MYRGPYNYIRIHTTNNITLSFGGDSFAKEFVTCFHYCALYIYFRCVCCRGGVSVYMYVWLCVVKVPVTCSGPYN